MGCSKLLPTAQVNRHLARSDFKMQDPWEETHVNHFHSVQSDDGRRREPPAPVRKRRVTPRGSPEKVLHSQALDLAPWRKGTGQRRAWCRSSFLRKQVSRDTQALWLLAWVWQLPGLLKERQWPPGEKQAARDTRACCFAFMAGVWSAVN